MRLYAEGGLFHLEDSYGHKEMLKSIGCRFDKKKKTWCLPICAKSIKRMKGLRIGFQVSSDNTTWEAINLLKSQEVTRAFLNRYMNELVTGKREPDLSNMRFKEGISPFKHQRVALDLVKYADFMALFWDCGLGKTFVICQWMQFLKDNTNFKRGLIVTPKSSLHTTWMNDIKKFTWLDPIVLDRGSKSNEKVLTKAFKPTTPSGKKYNKDFDVYIITYESMAVMKDILATVSWDFMAMDESTKIKNPKSNRSKAAVYLADAIPRKVIMAGLPSPNGPQDIYMQIRALTPEMFGADYMTFMNDHFIPYGIPLGNGQSFIKWEPRPDGMANIQDTLAERSLKLKMEDSGIDLPGSIYVKREAYMSKKSFSMYKDMVEACLVFIKNTTVYAEKISKAMKLRQLTSEFIIDAEGNPIDLGSSHAKIDVLKEIVSDEIGVDPDTGKQNRVIIWSYFKYEYKLIKEALGDRAVIVSDCKDISEAIQKFKNWDIDFLIANPVSMGYSHTLTEAKYSIWFSYFYSSEQYYQANRRIERIGQTAKAVIFHILGVGPNRETTVDDVMLKIIDKKLTNNESLLSAIEEALDFARTK
jgi:hypothetical protein